MGPQRALGEMLRELRVQAGLTQEELAAAAKVDSRTISDLERHRTIYPRPVTALGIADALGLTGAKRENWLSLARPPAGIAVAYQPDALITADFAAATIAEAVSELRRQRGLSPAELSQRASLNPRTVTDIEAGRRGRLRTGTAVRLADELGLDGAAREHFLSLAAGADENPDQPETVPPAGLLGRERESADVADLLQRRRLVILTGPGGVGKTRLAGAVLATLDREHLELDLTKVPARASLARAITLTCGFDEGADWAGQLDALLPAGAVLFLDNLEHLHGVPEAVSAVMASRADVTVLATSRTRGGLDADAEYALGPLPLPAACQVFWEVARRSGRPLPAKLPAALVEQVCARLDQLPLPIILAATWSRLMTPRDILARIDQPADILRVPDRGDRGDQPRHSAVVSTVGWSLALVSDPARALFRALSAYPSPWPLDLVEAVSPVPRLDPLHELVEAGLVSVTDNDAGGTSYSMLQTVRDVGHSELAGDPGWHAEVLQRHADYLLQRARELGPSLFTDERATALTQCDQLAPHVQGAFEHLTSTADERAVGLAGNWWQYWFHRGQYRRGLAVVTRALEVSGATAEDTAAALYGAAALASYGGENDQAAVYAAEALDAAETAGDTRRIGSALSLIGMLELYAGNPEAALGWYKRGLAEIDSETDPKTYANLLTNAAPVYSGLGDVAAARAAAEDAVRRYQALGYQQGVAANLGNLADWAVRAGDPDRARELLFECRQLQETLGDSYNVIQVTISLGKLAANEGDAATAQDELDAARHLMREAEDPWCEADADALAAQIAVLNGRWDDARQHARSALRAGDRLTHQAAIVTAALADAAAFAWRGERDRTLQAARTGLAKSDQAHEAVVVSLALLVTAVHLDSTSPALVTEDVLVLERLIRQWAAVPGAFPYVIAVRSAWRRGLRLTPPATPRDDAPPIGELRQLALTLCNQTETSTAPE